MSTLSDTPALTAEALGPLPVAVIDIGTTSIRMAIGELIDGEEVRTLESLSQAVNLGKDTFTRGRIKRETIESCVRVLRSFLRILDSYGIRSGEQIRVVATSAVREAENRLVFLDRIFSATGLQVEPIEEGEVIRLAYLGVQPYLKRRAALAEADLAVIEVGGGNTELLLIRNGEVAFAHSYPLGSMRLRELLASHQAGTPQAREIMATRIQRTVAQIAHQIGPLERCEMIALGGDVRFAASRLAPDWDEEELAVLPLDQLEELTDELLQTGEDELVTRHRLAFQEAETVGPALLAYALLARALKLERLMVSRFNLRDGLLRQKASRKGWSDTFAQQIVRSALELGRRYEFDEAHALHTAELCDTLFEGLAGEHGLSPHERLLMRIAALLHEIGHFVSPTGHHKHSAYLIQHSELFGLNQQDLDMVALVARYHRAGPPKANHRGYSKLSRHQRIAVSKMAALLRVADSLESARSQRLRDIRCQREEGTFLLTVPDVHDLSLERMTLRQKGGLFQDVFGLRVVLKSQTG